MVVGLPNVHVPDRMCKVCSASKQPRNFFCSYFPMRSLEVLHVAHSDVCGPFEVASLGGNKYFVSFVGEHIRMMWLYLIKAKSEVFEVYKRFKSMVKDKLVNCSRF